MSKRSFRAMIACLILLMFLAVIWALWRTPRIAHLPHVTHDAHDAIRVAQPSDPTVIDAVHMLPRCTGVDAVTHTVSVWDLPYPASVGCKVRFYRPVRSCSLSYVEDRGVRLKGERAASSLVVDGALVIPGARQRDIYRYDCKESP